MVEKEIKYVVIKCPHCGWEYLPCEIFYPDSIGDASGIVRDEAGKILYFDGDSLNFKEEYCCDNCGTSFKISGTVAFDVSEVETLNSDEDGWSD